MDYSIHNNIVAEFNKIIFIIKKDIERDFINIIGNRNLGEQVMLFFLVKN